MGRDSARPGTDGAGELSDRAGWTRRVAGVGPPHGVMGYSKVNNVRATCTCTESQSCKGAGNPSVVLLITAAVKKARGASSILGPSGDVSSARMSGSWLTRSERTCSMSSRS
eukprot:scaffold242349_cov30-Tisochrysis_lutea.AAC.2